VTGAELRQMREAAGLSQEELGRRLGIAPNTIARWERGELTMRHPGLLRLALLRLQEHPEWPPSQTGF
jgi:transcriptional regulator with XRE-family HTH domain